MTNVTINGLTAVHAGSNGILTTTDVCKTPPLCPPIPYTNIAKSTDAAMTATSVKINGNPACTLTSNFAVSQGDSPGGCGGIISGTVNGMAEFLMGSPNVFIEGIPVVRQTDMMVSNFKNTPPMPLQQPGAGKPPDVSAEAPKELEAAELPFVVDIEVAGKKLTKLKSIIGAVDLELAPDEITGEPAKLKKASYDDNPSEEVKPLTRKLLVRAVSGPTSLNVGDTVTYKVTKTNLDDASPEELQHVNWQLKSDDGKVIKEFKNHGAKLEFVVDNTLKGINFKVMPYIKSPTPKVSVSTNIAADLIPLKKGESLSTKKVEGTTMDKVGNEFKFKVTKLTKKANKIKTVINTQEIASDQLQKISWRIEKRDGTLIKIYKNHGPELTHTFSAEMKGVGFLAMPYFNSPSKRLAVDGFVSLEDTTTKLCWGKHKNVNQEIKTKIIDIATDLGFKPDYLMACIYYETARTFLPSTVNTDSGATGFIQWMKRWAPPTVGKTIEELGKMGAIEQLDYVRKYFIKRRGTLHTLEDVYFAILMPSGIGKQGEDVIFTKGDGYYEGNKHFDEEVNGKKSNTVTANEVSVDIRAAFARGNKPKNYG